MSFLVHWPKSDADHLIVTSREMLNLEEMILSSGLPVEALMEKVGQKMSRWFLNRANLISKGVIVLVGPGHNGGDGLVVARELHLAGINVSIWCPFPFLKPLTIKQFSYATWLGIKQIKNIPNAGGEELWIEALLGVGQSRTLPSKILDLLESRQIKCPGKLVSLDVPAGLCSDTGRPLKRIAACASFTLTVGFYKRGLIQDAALPFVGNLIRIDFGFPEKVLREWISKASCRVNFSDINNFDWPTPSLIASKYERGRVLVIAGSEKYPGAAVLTIKGVLASGAGSLKAALPKILADSFWEYQPEVVLAESLAQSRTGGLNIGTFLQNYDFHQIDSLVIGPGIGFSDEIWSEVSSQLEIFEGLIIFDADALNRISKDQKGWQWLRKRKGNTVITPHIQEFKRLFKDIDHSCPISAAIEAAKLSGAGILLKGAHSVFAAPSGESWVIGESAPWVARTGLGDVLAGFLAGVGSLYLAIHKRIDWDIFAAATLIHASSAKDCKNGSTATEISSFLAAEVKNINKVEYLEKEI